MAETTWKKKLFLILVFIESSFLLFWGAKSYYQVRQAQNQVKKVEEELRSEKLLPGQASSKPGKEGRGRAKPNKTGEQNPNAAS